MKFIGMTKDEQPTYAEIHKKLIEEIKLREQAVCFSQEDEDLKYVHIKYLQIVAENMRIRARKESRGDYIPTDKMLLKGAMNWLYGDTRHTTKKVDRVDTFDYSDKDVNTLLDEMGYGV